jgi:hypothetical protein
VSIAGEGSVIEVWKDGVLETSEVVSSAVDTVGQFTLPSAFSWRTIYEFLAPVDTRELLRLIDDRTFAPQFFVHGILGRTNLVQPVPDPVVREAELPVLNASAAGPCMPSNVYFGAWDDGSIYPVGNYSREGFSATPLDFDEHVSTVGAACEGEVWMVSVARLHGDVDQSFDYVHSPVDPKQLPVLTAVAGGDRRYHPIWHVGAPPEAPAGYPPDPRERSTD